MFQRSLAALNRSRRTQADLTPVCKASHMADIADINRILFLQVQTSDLDNCCLCICLLIVVYANGYTA